MHPEPLTAPTIASGAPAGNAARIDFSARYVDLGTIARGGWGEVRRVHDTTMDRVIVAKVLASEHVDSHRIRGRFSNEARVTASLDHPGVVPIYDAGTLADGRPWFAMKEVSGAPWAQLLDGRSQSPGPVSLRRDIQVLLRVAEVAGHAHERGVVHRDLKPSNVMIGRAGEVLVVDWGIAKVGGAAGGGLAMSPTTTLETMAGEMLGTLAYAAPEQVRGEEAGPASDVYALGLVLYEILHARRARAGNAASMQGAASRGDRPVISAGPDELRAICEAAVAPHAEARPATAAVFAAALRGWLEGIERVARAEAAVSDAVHIEPEVRALRSERERLRAEARKGWSEVRDHDAVDRKAPLWALEDQAAELDEQVARLDTQRTELLRVALQHEPSLPAAHAALAEIHRARLIDAEAQGDRSGAAREALLLGRHDRGEHRDFLRGVGRIELDTVPTDASVVAHRYREHERRLVLERVGLLGRTPLSCELPAGSYMLEVGESAVRYPVVIERGQTWDATYVRDGASPAVDLDVPLGIDECYVPAGFTWLGGDPLAAESLPSQKVWVNGFVIQRFPVTRRHYLTFLDDLLEREGVEAAERCAPRLARAANATTELLVARDGSKHRMLPDEHGNETSPDAPIVSIDWLSAVNYGRWFADRTGLPWRLPDEFEWEKAARGVDRRRYPWGNQPEPTWANVLGTRPDSPRLAPVDSYPVDESPYGVRGLAGNVRDWCAHAWSADGPNVDHGVLCPSVAEDEARDMRVIRGGAWTSVPAFARCAGRFAANPDERFAVVGMRLVRPLSAR